MKKTIITGLALMLFIFPSVSVFAEEVPGAEKDVAENYQADIVLDGVFDDWSDKPSVMDKEADSGTTGQDLKEIKYHSDDNYLYLYVERYTAEQGMDLWIPIINGEIIGDNTQNVFLPWDERNVGKPGGEWVSTPIPCFKIHVDYASWDNSLQVKPKINTTSIGEDKTYYNADGTKFEVRLPLEKVGLAGGNKEIIFNVASDISQWAPTNIDWGSDKGPIVITQGPVFGSLTSVIALAGFVGVGAIATKKRTISDIQEK